ncbi:MAG TPA: PAS domain-containing protein, partial [Polyangia bacterium]
MTGTTKNGQSREGTPGGLDAVAPAALRMLLEKTPVALWVVDRELRLTFTGGAGLVAVGLRPGEGVGLSLYEHLGHDDSFPPVASHLAALRGEVIDIEHEWRGRLMAIRLAPVRAEAGSGLDVGYEGVIGVALDVTEQREAERGAEKLQSELRQGRRSDAAIRAL